MKINKILSFPFSSLIDTMKAISIVQFEIHIIYYHHHLHTLLDSLQVIHDPLALLLLAL